VTFEVHASKSEVDSVELDVVGLAVEHASADVGQSQRV
jgi:hypothetical protein